MAIIDVPPQIHQRAAAVDLDVLLDCIHEVENPENVRKPGAHGELGPYQMTRATWEQFSHLPFNEEVVCNPVLSREVARRRLAALSIDLQRHFIQPTAWRLAAGWNGGHAAALHPSRCAASTAGYADRVCNLMHVFQKAGN